LKIYVYILLFKNDSSLAWWHGPTTTWEAEAKGSQVEVSFSFIAQKKKKRELKMHLVRHIECILLYLLPH
jgi:hypothetical protein